MDLQSMVNTSHVDDINSAQELRYQAEKVAIAKMNDKLENATLEEREDLLQYINKDESDKRTVLQHYPKLRSEGFQYQLYAIYTKNYQAYVKK